MRAGAGCLQASEQLQLPTRLWATGLLFTVYFLIDSAVGQGMAPAGCGRERYKDTGIGVAQNWKSPYPIC